MCFLVISMSSLEKCLFRYSVLLFFFNIELYELFVYFGINPFSVALFANIFSYSVGCLFVLFMVSFVVQKLLSLFRSHF